MKVIYNLSLLILITFILSILSLDSSKVTSGKVNMPQANLTVYGDTLATGWTNWSWLTTVDFAHAGTVQSGSNAVAVTYTSSWAAFYLHPNSNVTRADYAALGFWIHGSSSGGQSIDVILYDGTGNAVTPAVSTNVIATANAWTYHEFTMAELGNPPAISGLLWQDTTGGTQPTYYLDNIVLLDNATPPPTPTPTPLPSLGPALTVDVSQVNGPISEHIYGLNFADAALAAELSLPVNRWGGNSTTRYNWQLDTSSRAADWYFENIPNTVTDASQLPNNSSSDQFVIQNITNNTESMLTIPMIGWTPKDRNGISCSYSVALYGLQTDTDPWRPDCGNGIELSTGAHITSNDPLDIHIPITETFVISWMNHLINTHGTANSGGVRFYSLDNEPMLWNETHRDVHPHGTSYDEIRDLTYRYAAALKTVDPDAQTLGPVLWGWTAYEYSAFDTEASGAWWTNPQDRNAHGGTPFVEWYLQEMAAYEAITGTRILDYLDLHYYPQSSNVTLAPVGDITTQALRLRSTRALWDSTYVDESWINQSIELIPRMHNWVDTHYPDTKLALSEYNWGGLEHINGALAQADVLGIFGREGLDLATLWSPPANNDPGAFAFRMYRNYDGAGSQFGDLNLTADSADQDQLSVYASIHSGNTGREDRVTIMVVNKSMTPLSSTVTINGIVPGVTYEKMAQVYRYSDADLSSIVNEVDQDVSAANFAVSAASFTAVESNFTDLFPGDSITLFVLDPVAASSYTMTKILDSVEPLRPGEPLHFTIQITNTGSVTLTQMELRDNYQNGYLAYMAATPAPDSTLAGELQWDNLLGTAPLGPGQTITVAVEFTARQDTTLLPQEHTINQATAYNVAYQTGSEPPTLLENQTTSDTVQIFAPTAVLLANNALSTTALGISLEWQTATEVNMSSFHLYRQKLGNDDTLQPLTTIPLMAQHAGTLQGGRYQYVDRTAILGETYRYVLEIMDLYVQIQQVDLGTVQHGWQMYLPFITKS